VGPAMAFMGDWEPGPRHVDRALELFDPDRPQTRGFRIGPNPGVAAAAVSALLHWQFGFPETADVRAARALELAAQLDHPYSRAYATFHVGLLDMWCGRIALSRQRAQALAEIAAAHDYGIWAATALVLEGAARAEDGDTQEAVAVMQRGLALYRERPTPPVFWPLVLSLNGMVLIRAGRPADALGVLDEAAVTGKSEGSDAAFVQQLRGAALLATADLPRAIEAFRMSIRKAETAGARTLALMAGLQMAGVSAAGRAEALETLRSIVPTLTEGLDTPLVVAALQLVDPELARIDA